MGIRRLTDAGTPLPWLPARDGGLRLSVRLTPKAGRDAIAGIKPTADGHAELDVRVTAVPEKGRANAALVALLAKMLRLPAGAFTLVAGETDRHKQILIDGDAAVLDTALRALIAAGPARKG